MHKKVVSENWFNQGDVAWLRLHFIVKQLITTKQLALTKKWFDVNSKQTSKWALQTETQQQVTT